MTIYYIVALAIAIVFHEVSHGFVAYLCGDPTAKQAGRLTLNPLSHVDPIGSVLLPASMLLAGLPPFGYAKPVPVNFSRLRHPRNQSVFVSIAGPATNVLLGGVGIALGRLSGCHYSVFDGSEYLTWHSSFQGDIGKFALTFVVVNASIAAFNLLPIPPLDGSVLIERLLPKRFLDVYFSFRSIALPFTMVLFVLDGLFFHVTSGVLGAVRQAAANLVFSN